MRLEEYTQHLKSDSPTIAFSTEHGKMIVCRKQANEIEDLLKSAKQLLQDMIEAKNVSTIEAIHRLRDLAQVLNQLKLQEECLVVGDCAIKLAQALGLRAVKFQVVTAQTIILIAGLDVYKSRMRPLFIQAISLCEATMIEDESDSARIMLLTVLSYAGTFARGYPALSAQWLGRAVDLIAELPSAMVTDELRSLVYHSYGLSLVKLEQYPKALAAGEYAVELFRSLASKYDGPYHKGNLACALKDHGATLSKMGHSMNALSVEHEAVSLFRALVVRGQEEQKDNLADTLLNYGYSLYEVCRFEDAINVQQEAVSLCRALVVRGGEEQKERLAVALQDLGYTLSKMGRLEDVVGVQRENVTLFRALAVHGQAKQKKQLAFALQNYGNTLLKMQCLEDALSAKLEVVSLLRALVIHEEEQKVDLARALMSYGYLLFIMGCLEDALSAKREAVSLFRALVVRGQEEQKENLALALHNCGYTLSEMGCLEDAVSAQQEAVSLFGVLAVHGEEEHKLKYADALKVYVMYRAMQRTRETILENTL